MSELKKKRSSERITKMHRRSSFSVKCIEREENEQKNERKRTKLPYNSITDQYIMYKILSI